MNTRFKCTECDRFTERFISTIEGPEETFDDIIHYCHFCDIGFYILPNSRVELVEIEKPRGMPVFHHQVMRKYQYQRQENSKSAFSGPKKLVPSSKNSPS